MTRAPTPALDDASASAENLLWEIARIADGIARERHRARTTPVSDLEVWEQAERKILGESPVFAGLPGE